MATEVVQLVSIILLIHVDFLYAQRYMRACVFKSESRLRTNSAAFTVRNIDFTLCTHYIYFSARIDLNAKSVMPAARAEEEGPNGLYKQFNDGKKALPGTKTVLTFGGEGISNDADFERLYSRDPLFLDFSQNAVAYVKAQGFDGINIFWEMANDTSGKQVLPKLLQALREVIDQDTSSKLLLTMTGYAMRYQILRKYNVTELNASLDYVFVDCKYLVSQGALSFLGPLYYHPGSSGVDGNLNNSIESWKTSGMPFAKLLIGVTALGHYVRMRPPVNQQPGGPATADILRGNQYNISSRLAYPEVCTMMQGSRKYYDNVQKSSYLVRGDEWVGYTDPVCLDDRIQYMRSKGLAGIYFTNLDEDDFTGLACNAGRSPLVTHLRDTLDPVVATVAPPETTTVMTETTTETQREETEGSSLPTTVASEAEDTPTTTTAEIAPQEEDGDPFSTIGYLLLLFLFIIGHIIGHLFMRFARTTYDLYKQL